MERSNGLFLYALTTVLGIVGVFISIFYEYFLGFEPCPYCLGLRILYMFVAVLGLAACIKRFTYICTLTLAAVSIVIIVFSWAAANLECCMLSVPKLLGVNLSSWSMAGGILILLLMGYILALTRPSRSKMPL